MGQTTRRRLSSFIVACAAVGAAPVFAASSSATLSNFQIKVVDLTPGDGLAAGFDALAPTVDVFGMARGIKATPGNQARLTASDWNAPLDIGVSDTFQGLALAATARNDKGLLAVAASSENVPANTLAQVFRTSGQSLTSFTIRPNTKLVFDGDASITNRVMPCGAPRAATSRSRRSFSG